MMVMLMMMMMMMMLMGMIMRTMMKLTEYCRTHNVSVCLYIAYIACGSPSLYIKTLYFFFYCTGSVSGGYRR